MWGFPHIMPNPGIRIIHPAQIYSQFPQKDFSRIIYTRLGNALTLHKKIIETVAVPEGRCYQSFA